MIGLITVSNDTFTNPVLYALIEHLGQQGHKVALFNDKNQPNAPTHLKNVNYFDAPKGIQLPLRPRNLIKYLLLYGNIIKLLKSNNITHLIAVDSVGLVLAGRLKRLRKDLKIHYFSFEIFFNEEVKNNPIYNSLKKKEIFYTKSVSSIVIQDRLRMNNLMKENKINADFANWHLIPVAPIVKKTYREHHRAEYGLRDSELVYIHSGSVSEWSGINQIITAIQQGLPKNTIVFIHNRSKFDKSNPVHKKLIEMSASNPSLLLHDEAFNDYHDYLSFLMMFDYGIVLYEPDGGIFTGHNIGDIGLSSGKFSSYMAASLPSLMFDCEMYREIVDTFNVGSIVSVSKNLSFHIKKNTLNEIQKTDCVDFYHKILNPESHIQKFIAKELLN